MNGDLDIIDSGIWTRCMGPVRLICALSGNYLQGRFDLTPKKRHIMKNGLGNMKLFLPPVGLALTELRLLLTTGDNIIRKTLERHGFAHFSLVVIAIYALRPRKCPTAGVSGVQENNQLCRNDDVSGSNVGVLQSGLVRLLTEEAGMGNLKTSLSTNPPKREIRGDLPLLFNIKMILILLKAPGLASNPGPCHESPRYLKAATWNINSFHKHRAEMLTRAIESKISLIFLQETRVTKNGMASAVHFCQRHGWQFVGSPASSVPGGGVGGVAILAREPLALTLLESHCDTWGQVLSCELLGHGIPITVMVGYRRPGEDVQAPNEALFNMFQKSKTRHWIFACDWNCNPEQGSLPELMYEFQAHLGASSGHLNSSSPTDSVWLAPSLQAWQHAPLNPLSDHFGSLITLKDIPRYGPEPKSWEIKKVRTLVTPLPETQPDDNLWNQVAPSEEVWSQSLGDINKAWKIWCSTAEHYLSRVGCLNPNSGGRPRGSKPTLVAGASRQAPGQSQTERRLRRLLRRLDELRSLQKRGTQVSHGLVRACQRGCISFGWDDLACSYDWAQCRKKVQHALNDILQRSQRDSLQAWKTEIRTYEGACRWLKKGPPPPWTINSSFGTTTGRGAGAEHLRQIWEPVFAGPSAYIPQHDEFLKFYEQYVPTCPTVSLPQLTKEEFRAVVGTMKRKAAGPDGWSSDLMLQLPDQAWDQLVSLVQQIEAKGQWPADLHHWKITFIPKSKSSGAVPTEALKVRPVSVGPLLYRCWAKLRFRHISWQLVQCLAFSSGRRLARPQCRNFGLCLAKRNLTFLPPVRRFLRFLQSLRQLRLAVGGAVASTSRDPK